ncbi:MAG: Permease of the major facilitator superfamily [Rhizobacter sp.]|nr:Permease of the major facilitator superfamily [Rhizobacter sp.]
MSDLSQPPCAAAACTTSLREPPAAPLTARWLVMLLAAASGLSVANVYYAQPLLDALSLEFGMASADVGLVVTATQAGSVAALLLLVPLGDRFDRRALMAIQMVLLCAALLAVCVAGSPTTLLLAMLAVGLLGTASTQGLIAYAAATAAPNERGRVVGTVQAGVVIGLLLARVFAGALADAWNWRAVYLVSAALSLPLAALLWRTLPRSPRPQERLSYGRLLASMFGLLAHDRVLRTRGVIAMLMFAALSIFWSAVVLPLSAPPFSLSHTAIGSLGLVGVLGALAAGRSGRWADRGLAQRTTGAALLLLMACWLPLALMPHAPWALVVGVVALDLAGQAIHVTNQSMIFRSSSAAASRLVGCYMVFYAVGSGAGAIASTQVYATAGWNGVCLLGAGVSALALVFWKATAKD